MTEARRTAVLVLLVTTLSVTWMAWPLPLELGTAWTSARAEGDLAWSLVLHSWTTDILTGAGAWSGDTRVWFPDGGALASSAWNLVALLLTGALGIGVEPLEAWHRSMLFVGLCNGLGGGWLGWRVGGQKGAVLAAIACAASPLAWFEMCEGRLEQGLTAPLAVCAAEAWAWSRARRPALLGASLGLVAATYWFLGPIALAAFAVLPLVGPDRTWPSARNLLRPLGIACIVGLATVAIALLPILDAAWSGAQQAAVSDGQLSRVQRLASAVSPLQLLMGGPLPAHRLPAVALALIPMTIWRAEARPWVAAMAVGGALAAGTVLSTSGSPLLVGGFEWRLPLGLFDVLPGFSRFWWPDRIVAVVLVAAAGGLASLMPRVPRQWAGPLVVVLGVGWAMDGRLQLRAGIASGDPRIPTSSLDPRPQGGFYAAPLVPTVISDGAILTGPWGTTANLIPLLGLQNERPLIRGDGAADARLWPAAFARRVDESSLLTALHTGNSLPTDTASQLDDLGIASVVWLGQSDQWTTLLDCAPVATGPWRVWDRSRGDCR